MKEKRIFKLVFIFIHMLIVTYIPRRFRCYSDCLSFRYMFAFTISFDLFCIYRQRKYRQSERELGLQIQLIYHGFIPQYIPLACISLPVRLHSFISRTIYAHKGHRIVGVNNIIDYIQIYIYINIYHVVCTCHIFQLSFIIFFFFNTIIFICSLYIIYW